MSDDGFKVISPVDGRVWLERSYADDAEIEAALGEASCAALAWRTTSLAERKALVGAMVEALVAKEETLAEELSWQMGRPIRYGKGEIAGFRSRAETMLSLSDEALADIVLEDLPGASGPGFRRFIRREPVGVVVILAPWNYPWLTAVNTLVPALLAGNTVLLKHADQTPLVAERLAEAARSAGLPPGVFQALHMSHAACAKVVADPRVAFVAFTGSVQGGQAISRALAGRFAGAAYELGGNDPGYVRADADLSQASESLVDGAFFNSGQSCCGIERIYVHAAVYDDFVERALALTKAYVLDDPTRTETTLGPVVRVEHAKSVQAHIDEALSRGARSLLAPETFTGSAKGLPYLAPQLLVDVDHGMLLMKEETFGPVVGIQRVSGDEEALALMNDSHYGLTASIWTQDLDAGLSLGEQVHTGTFFVNRCDYLDPELAWVGIKDSGRGCSLSRLGYEALTRPKSFHLRRF